VELNSRYFDALLFLLRYPGTLISKERFLQEVWQGIPVTDGVLTQCIKALRRQLRDSATHPHLIETTQWGAANAHSTVTSDWGLTIAGFSFACTCAQAAKRLEAPQRVLSRRTAARASRVTEADAITRPWVA
jgi:hypothetical protein